MNQTGNTPSSYLLEINKMKTRAKGIMTQATGSGVVTGASIGAVIGIGYGLIYKKQILKSALVGALLGTVLAFSYIQTKKSKKDEN